MISLDQRLPMLIGALLIALPALAQTPGDAERQALVEQAQAAAKAGDDERALSLALRAGEIRMTPSLRLFIAEEQSAVGQYADSITNAEICVREANQDKALRNRQRIIRQCRSLTAKLEKAAARLIVFASDPVPSGLEVTVNGRPLQPSMFAKPYLLPAGRIQIRATAPGYQVLERELAIPAGQEGTVTVRLNPELIAQPQVQPPPPVEKQEVPPIATAQESGSKGGSIGPYIVLGAGAVSVGVGAIFLILRHNNIRDLENMCSGPNHTVCPDTPQAHSLRDKASTDSAVANVTLGVGAAALVGGAVWLILDKTQGSGSSSRTQLQVTPTTGGAVVAVRGAL